MIHTAADDGGEIQSKTRREPLVIRTMLLRHAVKLRTLHATTRPVSFLGKLISQATEGRTEIGKDSAGREYFERDGPHGRRTRGVDFAKEDGVGMGEVGDPAVLPPEWQSWLSGTRTEAPTEAESAAIAVSALAMAGRVAALEELDWAERLGRGGGGGDAALDERNEEYLRATDGMRQFEEPNAERGKSFAAPEHGDSRGAHSAEGETYRPGEWGATQADVDATDQGSGEGDSFEPAGWTPGGR